MLSFLFRGLTADPHRGTALFDAVTAKAREPHWYVEGTVPDTLDGRFAVLTTITALVLARLEQAGERGSGASVALTERFIEVMESEHRELGLGDPTLGKTVRKLVGSLARRTELWRLAVEGQRGWNEAARNSLYKEGVSTDGLLHSAEALKTFWSKVQGTSVVALEEGRLQ
jgi:cytochrome b pre-mRNA-processing protein 3